MPKVYLERVARGLGFASGSDHIEWIAPAIGRNHLVRLWGRIETALIEAERDELGLLVIHRGLPAEHRLGGEQAIGECDMAGATRLQCAGHICQNSHRLGQILERKREGAGIELFIIERHLWILIKVLNHMAGEFGVFGEFFLVHAKTGDRIERQVRWQVGAVGGHKIQDVALSW